MHRICVVFKIVFLDWNGANNTLCKSTWNYKTNATQNVAVFICYWCCETEMVLLFLKILVHRFKCVKSFYFILFVVVVVVQRHDFHHHVPPNGFRSIWYCFLFFFDCSFECTWLDDFFFIETCTAITKITKHKTAKTRKRMCTCHLCVGWSDYYRSISLCNSLQFGVGSM